MKKTIVGIKELKDHLSATLEIVKEGGEVTITERGKAIGRIVPFTEPVSEREKVLALVREGFLSWSGERPDLPSLEGMPTLPAGHTLCEAVIQDREEHEQAILEAMK